MEANAMEANAKETIAKEPGRIAIRLTPEVFVALYPEFANRGFNGRNFILVSETARRSIESHIGWGETTSANKDEQGGILIGKPFVIDGSYISVAEFAIAGEMTYSNSAYLKMGHETWMKMLGIYDDEYREKGYYIVGWYHTHPDPLPVFMSSTDRNTQQLYFQKGWHFAIVLNPQKKLAAFFNGADAEECAGYYAGNFMGNGNFIGNGDFMGKLK